MQFFTRNMVCLQNATKRVVALAIMIIITVSSVITVAAATYNAVIDYNGEKRTVQLYSDGTDEILAAAEIKLGADDLVERSPEQTPGGEIRITVKSAVQTNVHTDGQVKTVTLHYGDTVAQALSLAAVKLEANDLVTPQPAEKLVQGTDIQVKRRFTVSITADGQTKSALVSDGTVAQALDEAGVALGADDLVNVQKDAAVSEGMKINVSRVTYKEVTSIQPVAYQNKNESSASLYKGQTKIKTSGKNGSQSVVTRQKLIEGKVAASEVLSATVLEQPVDQVTAVGTKKKAAGSAVINGNGTVTDQNGKTISYKKCVSGRCTGYTGGGRTSTGKAAAFGLVAVNPKVIPYGSRLYICSPNGKVVYGYAIAADTGGGLMSGRIVADLYFDTVGQCRSFGNRNMNIYVL
ncbi:3D domain-containing protein [Caproiciproducens faecalis]|uniref:G5 domain-containing protein n=1 Tax=Caproiciproducens faecalis TaxID=2820301 RepID=A0ABS7DQM4_9FIRM|nr:3D domain-containing protein [Caproiciproducens faecalis]MBW7572881.1 G5 domain-containing protein [Caproiciproducens faecalis]